MSIDASNVTITTTAEEGTDLVTRDGAGKILASVPLPPERVNAKRLAEKIGSALTTNTEFLALTAPTNAQVVAQLKALTRQVSALTRLVTDRLDSLDGV